MDKLYQTKKSTCEISSSGTDEAGITARLFSQPLPFLPRAALIIRPRPLAVTTRDANADAELLDVVPAVTAGLYVPTA